MQARSYSTHSVSAEEVKREWFIIDAQDLILGRMATKVASVLRGKHKPTFTPHSDCGDYVIVINSDKVRMTGKKMTDRPQVHYTNHPGGQRFRAPKDIMAKNPNELIELSVRGMLPKNSLGRELFRKLFVYAGTEHPHSAQKPKSL